MGDKTIRRGSLQFYPRVRAKKILPRANWDVVKQEGKNLLGFIGYKAGMKSAFVKDDTPHSHTKGKKIIIPVTILECPSMKILSIRFYKFGKVSAEVLNDNLDKELKRKIKLPKHTDSKKKLEHIEQKAEFDDLRLVVYSQVKKTGIKKTPDISEIGLSGSLSEKLAFAKEHLTKEISIKEVFPKGVVDFRGVTKGKGTQGTVKRFGTSLKAHKSEKGLRTLGSGGPWHPSRVDFHQPRMGQMGYFTRVVYSSKIVNVGSISEKDINSSEGFKHYGAIKSDYIMVYGSIQGPVKRPLLISAPARESRKQVQKNYEFIEIR